MHNRIPGIREATKGIRDGDIDGVHNLNENRGMSTHYCFVFGQHVEYTRKLQNHQTSKHKKTRQNQLKNGRLGKRSQMFLS